MACKTILIPTDGSGTSNAAARSGIAFAREQGAQVIGLFAAATYMSALADLPPETFPTEAEHEASMRRKGAKSLAVLEEAARADGLEYTPVVAFSNSPAQAILNTAAHYGCDLIFMASHGRGGWNPVLIGDVTLKVLSASPIPVLVYRNGENCG